MAEVPAYGPRKQTLRPIFTRKMDSRATPDAFGAGVGRAMKIFASGIGNAADALATVRDLEDKAVVEERVNRYSDFARIRTYDPQSGYINQLGRDAVSGQQQFETDLENQRELLGKDLSPTQREIFNRATEVRRRQALDTGIKHASKQRREWFNDAAIARLDILAEDALAMSDEPDKLQLNLAAGQKEIADRGLLNGWSPEQIAVAQQEFVSGIHKNIVLKHAIEDPLRAKDWLDTHRDTMTEAHQFDLDKALDGPVLQARAEKEAGFILEGGGNSSVQRASGLSSIDMRVRTLNNNVDFENLQPDTKTAFGQLQAAMGRQLLVKSGYRSPITNKAVKGAKSSQHMQGTAVDIDVRGMSREERLDLISKAFDAGFTGIGVGPTTIHVDQGPPRAWGYATSAGGAPVPAYAAGLVNKRLAELRNKKSVQQTTSFEGWRVASAGKGYTELISPDGVVERREGTRAWRNNNPGNIEYGNFARSHGAIGTDGRFAVFPTYEAGRRAKESLLFDSKGYAGMTLAQAIERYAPRFENNTSNYIGTVAQAVGVSADTELSSLSPQQRISMLDAMERIEGFVPGTRGGGKDVPGFVGPQYIMGQVAHIEDPRLRVQTATQLARLYDAQGKVQRQAERQHKLEVERWIIDNPGVDPTKLPLELQQQLGVDGMNTLWSYTNRIKQMEEIETDELVYAQLQRRQAEDPYGFADDIDLFDYLDILSKEDRRYFQQKQAEAIRDRREGAEKALTHAKSISAAMSIANERLEAAGIRKSAADADDESRIREVRFQRALIDRMREFQREHQRIPNGYEISDIVDELLLPIIIREPGILWGTNEEDAFAFEAPYRADDAQVWVSIPYENIPVDIRLGLREDLIHMGEDPDNITEEMIKRAYIRDVLGFPVEGEEDDVGVRRRLPMSPLGGQ